MKREIPNPGFAILYALQLSVLCLCSNRLGPQQPQE
jgi:hypothetical protein